MNIDIGGQKHRRDLGVWRILDSSPAADFVHILSDKPLPFKNESIDNIYTSNTLEHVAPEHLTFNLQEFYRVLKFGGKCRIVVPDVAHAINLYINNQIITTYLKAILYFSYIPYP